MGSAQDLRKRIKSVTNTQQITKAMKMVASARLRRAQNKAKSIEPYANRLQRMLSNAAAGLDMSKLKEPLLEVRPVERTAYILIGADKGLAGAYTSNLLKYFQHEVQQVERDAIDIIAVGRKPHEYLKNNKFSIPAFFDGFSDKPHYEAAVAIAKSARELFVSGQVDRVVMIYTHFVNSLTQNVTSMQLLPVEPPEEQQGTEEYIFVPNQGSILSDLLPKYLECTIYNALLQGAASELGARMTAMTAATDNAGELISTLHLEYNKLRQAGITNEISEIVGGANALQ